MTVWFVLALMTAAAIFAVLWPLAATRRICGRGSDVAVYRDQLDEIERDRAAGRIGETRSGGRAGRSFAPADRRRRCASRAAGRGAPARRCGAAGRPRSPLFSCCRSVPPALYLALGSPGCPTSRWRRASPLPSRTIDREPDRAGREPSRAQSRGRPRLGGDRADLSAAGPLRGRGEGAAQRASPQRRDRRAPGRARRGAGFCRKRVVTAEAKAAFERAVALDAERREGALLPRPGGRAGRRREQAAAIWRAMLADAPPDAPWVEFVRAGCARGSASRRHPRGPSRRPGRGGLGLEARAAYRHDPRHGRATCRAARIATAPTSKAGCGWCAPIWCWAIATRRAPRSPMRDARCQRSRQAAPARRAGQRTGSRG